MLFHDITKGLFFPASRVEQALKLYAKLLGYGKAAGIQITGVAPKKIAAYAETLLPNKGGIGIYGTFAHIDVRETKSHWNG